MSRTDNYTVWVGGVEINDHLLSKRDANHLAEMYRSCGYDDVCVEHY